MAVTTRARCVVVDDSIVRGSTTRQIVQMLFDSGAAEGAGAHSSPLIVGPCFYGPFRLHHRADSASSAFWHDARRKSAPLDVDCGTARWDCMMAQKPLDPETKEWFADSTYGLLKLGSGRGRQHENVAVG